MLLGARKGQESHVRRLMTRRRENQDKGKAPETQIYHLHKYILQGLESASDLNTIITIPRPARDTGTVTDA